LVWWKHRARRRAVRCPRNQEGGGLAREVRTSSEEGADLNAGRAQGVKLSEKEKERGVTRDSIRVRKAKEDRYQDRGKVAMWGEVGIRRKCTSQKRRRRRGRSVSLSKGRKRKRKKAPL